MPELPEVETSRRGIEPHIHGQTIEQVSIRQHQLRWPIPATLPHTARGQRVEQVLRRGKYLILQLHSGSIIIHLGMSGSLRITTAKQQPDKHDHIDFCFSNNKILRLHDPRKFGCVLWTDRPVEEHSLIKKLGPEPLSDAFNAEYLHRLSRKRTASIKSFIMNSHIVVGVGNIYASESLFKAGISPKRRAGNVSLQRYQRLVNAIKETLAAAIRQGGTTLRDFTAEDGRPGYFAQQLAVYGRSGQPCPGCSTPVKQINQQQRSTFYCTQCQR